jgi:hypothetical protein
MLVAVVVGLGFLWAIQSLRKRSQVRPDPDIVQEDLKRSG